MRIGMEPSEISGQRLEPVAGRHGQILQPGRAIHLDQLAQSYTGDRLKTPTILFVEEMFRIGIGKGLDHGELMLGNLFFYGEGGSVRRGVPPARRGLGGQVVIYSAGLTGFHAFPALRAAVRRVAVSAFGLLWAAGRRSSRCIVDTSFWYWRQARS